MPTATITIDKKGHSILGGKIPIGDIVLFFPEGKSMPLNNGAVITEIKEPLPPEFFKKLTAKEEDHVLFLASMAKISFTDHDCEKRDDCIDATEEWWAFSCQHCPFETVNIKRGMI